MQLRTFDELSPSMDRDRLLIHLTALGGAADRRAVAEWRRRSNLFAEYVGVFAVDRGQVVGQTLVKRLSYTFPDRTETIGAIASVATHPERGRAGIARQILTEVHRREREAGIGYVTLWTNPSWGAHRLYEKLGYRDLYQFPWAVRAPRTPGETRSPRPQVRAGSRRDLAELERLHARRAADRIGFCRRPDRYLRILAATRELVPGDELLVTPARGAIEGYAQLQSNAVRVLCGELVAGSARARDRLVAAVERRAGARAIAFVHTPVTDSAHWFRRRGYGILPKGWYVYMAGSLERNWTARSAAAEFHPYDPRFLCLSGDRF